MLKLKAKEREQLRIKRLQSVIKVQKCVRGFLERLRFMKMKQNFKYMRKLRRLLSIAYGKLRSKHIKSLISVLNEIGL